MSNTIQASIPTFTEARAILSRFNASHFDIPGKEHARYSIPANPRGDDDLRLAAFITWAEDLASYALSVRKDRTVSVDEQEFCLQTPEWCDGLLDLAQQKSLS